MKFVLFILLTLPNCALAQRDSVYVLTRSQADTIANRYRDLKAKVQSADLYIKASDSLIAAKNREITLCDSLSNDRKLSITDLGKQVYDCTQINAILRKERDDARPDFFQKNWYVIAAVTFAIGVFLAK